MQYDAVTNGRAGKPIGDVAGKVATNIEVISKMWAEYMATYLTPEEKVAADSFALKRKNYVENAIKPALALLADRKYDEASTLLAGKASELFALAKQDLDKLVAIQVKEAKAEYEAAERQYTIVIGIAAAILIMGLLLGGLLGRQTIRAIVRPLGRLNEVDGEHRARQTRQPHIWSSATMKPAWRCAICRRCRQSSASTAKN